MLYAFEDGDELIICAANTLEDFERRRAALEGAGYELPDIVDILQDPRLEPLQTTPLVLTFSDADKRQAFIERYEVNVVSRAAAYNHHKAMFPDPFYEAIKEITEGRGDKRTIGEQLGINPDDLLSEEERKAAAEAKEKGQRRSGGGMTNDSFASHGEKQKGFRITGIRAHTDENGNLITDAVDVIKLKEEPKPSAGFVERQPIDDEERFEELMISPGFDGSDFVFAIAHHARTDTSPREVIVTIVSRLYWETFKRGYDAAEVKVPVNDLLERFVPEGSVPFHHGAFIVELTTAEARQFMREQGLTLDIDFQNAVTSDQLDFGLEPGGSAPDEIGAELGLHYPYRVDDFRFGVIRAPNPRASIVGIKPTSYVSSDPRSMLWIEDYITPLLKGMLPKGFVEESPAHFIYLRPIEMAREVLTQAGFVEDPELTKFFEKAVDFHDSDPNDPNSADLSIPGNSNVYFKVEFKDLKQDEVRLIATNTDDSFDLDTIQVARNVLGGCWFAFVREARARVFADILNQAGVEDIDVYAVNPMGERIVEKGAGAEVVDKKAEVAKMPRPWNDLAEHFHAATGEERAALIKGYRGEEFIFASDDIDGGGAIIHITPKSYFDENEDHWREPLDIAHLLPPDLEEVGPGIYITKARSAFDIDYDLERRGMIESPAFQIHLNFDR